MIMTNINPQIKNFLQKLGLSGNEVKLYLASLKLGEAKVSQLAKATKIHRVAIYPLIDSLLKKGLLLEVKQDNKRTIKPLGPKNLKNIINQKKREIRKIELNFEELLPDMQALFRQSASKPRVQYYEGVTGLQQINNDIIETLSNGGITYSYAHADNLEKAFEGYTSMREGHVSLRVKHNIRNRVIMPNSPLVSKMIKTRKERLLEMAIVDEKYFPFKNDITIYKNKIAILSLEPEKIGVIIESRDIYEDQLAIFNLAWEGAKALGRVYV